jgi:hypothetical protein
MINVSKHKAPITNSTLARRSNACQKPGNSSNKYSCMSYKRSDIYGKLIENRKHFMQVDS